MEKISVRENFENVLTFLKDSGADADMIAFIQSRLDQDAKAKENAKAKRLEKNGGEHKEATNSPFYTNVRESVYKVLTTEFQSGDDLIAQAGVKTSEGKPVLAAQVAIALKPLLTDGTVVKGEVVVTVTGKDGLTRQTKRAAYKLA